MTSENIEKIIRDNNYMLLGEILVSEDDYSQLKGWVKSIIYQMKKGINISHDIKFALGMTQIAIHSYKDRNFWENFCDELGAELDTNKQTKLGKLFLNTIRHYELFEINSSSSSKQYVENIKAHAFVVNNYMDGWFDFWEDYYENSLFRQIDDFGEADVAALSDFMNDSLKRNKDDKVYVSSDSGVNASKSYKLLRATRHVFADCDSSATKELMKITLKMIHDARYDDKMPDCNLGRFENEFIKWYNNKQDSEKERYSKERKNHRPRSKNPYMEINLETEEVQIVIPKQRFLKEEIDENSRTLLCNINLNGKQIESREITLFESIGWFTSKKEYIPIFDDIFSDIEVTICNKCKQLSEKSDYIILDSDLRKINGLEKDKENIILLKKGADFTINKSDQVTYSDTYGEHWDIKYVNVTEDTQMTINGRPLNIRESFSREPYFSDIIDRYSVHDLQGNKLTACRKHPTIYRLIDKDRFDKLILFVNDRKYSHKELSFIDTEEYISDKDKLLLSINLNRLLRNHNEVYDISLDIPGEGKKHICKYVLLCDLKISTEKPKYIICENAEVRINTNTKAIQFNKRVSVTQNGDEWLLLQKITSKSTDIRFRLSLSELVTVKYQLPVIRWGFSENKITKGNVGVWYYDLQNPLYIEYPSTEEFKLILIDEERRIITEIKAESTEKKGIFKADITEIIEKVRERDKNLLEIIVPYNGGNKRLFKIIRKVIVEPKINFNIDENGIVYCQINKLIGKADIFVDIKNSRDNTVITEGYRLEEGKNILEELSRYGTYDVYPYMIEEDLFDCVKTVYPVIKHMRINDSSDIINSDFILQGVNIGGKNHLLDDKFAVEVKEALGDNHYTVDIYKNDYYYPLWYDVKLKITCDDEVFLALLEESIDMVYNKSDRSLYLSTSPKIKNYIPLDGSKIVFKLKQIQE